MTDHYDELAFAYHDLLEKYQKIVALTEQIDDYGDEGPSYYNLLSRIKEITG